MHPPEIKTVKSVAPNSVDVIQFKYGEPKGPIHARKIAIAQRAEINDRMRRAFGLTFRPMSSPNPPAKTAIQLSIKEIEKDADSTGNIIVPTAKPEKIAIPPIRGVGVRCAD